MRNQRLRQTYHVYMRFPDFPHWFWSEYRIFIVRSSKRRSYENYRFSHKKHKANESQEKMTVTSGKDVCRKIGHSDEVDGENQENTYIHDSFALDASYANYIRETVPKTVWSNDYLRELWDENAKYLKSIRESKNGYGFDDIGMGAAYTYSTMYQKIVEGYRNGTREVYVCFL